MFKPKKRALALVLAVLLLLGSFADVLGLIDFRVLAAGEHNYIANNGDDAVRTVTVQTGGDDYIEVRALTDTSPYGRAFSLYPKAEDADSYYAIAELPTQAEWKLGKTQGIAFYVELPDVNVSTLKVSLRLNGTDAYAANIEGVKIGYKATADKNVSWEPLTAQIGVLTEKSGFEGFVFIPYAAFSKDSVALNAATVAESNAIELMLAVASNDISDYKKDYLFDELGFYEGAPSYVRAVTVAYGTEYVANSGENAKDTVKLQWNCTDGQITYSQREDALAPYGKAIGLTTGDTSSGWNEFKTGIVVQPEATWDISATTGYAFYCELPDVGADTAMDIWWYINDDVCWNELQPGKPIYYVEDGSTEMETVNFSWDEYSLPGHDHGGFKGFIFVPFSSLKTRYSGKDRSYINEATYFELRIGIARRPDQAPDLAEQTFVFDEIGLYTEPMAYIEAAKAKSGFGEYEIIANNGADAASTVKLPANYDGVTITQEEVGVSPYGASIGVTTKASGWNANKTGIVLDSGDKDLTMSNGIAFYVKAPNVGDLDTALDVWLWNTDRYCWNSLVPGSNIYYIEQGSTTVTAVEFQESEYTYTLHGKSGFEGFVFIPFESFRCTWSDNEGKDLELIRERTKFEVRFNVAKTDAGLANKTFIFDELGFYRDPVSYVSAAQKHREVPKTYNHVGNDCSNVSQSVNVPQILGGRVIVSQQEAGITPYGSAMKMTLGEKGWNSEKVRVSMSVASDFEMSAAKGFAFYVKAPAVDAETDPCIDVLFYKNDAQYWQALENGKPIYYLENGSTTLTSEIFSTDAYTYPLSKRGGFEGFIFIPFDSLKMKYDGNDRDYINEAKTLQVWFNPARGRKDAPGLAQQTYIFDEFGFYSDELSYVDYCLKAHGSEVEGLELLSNTGTDSSLANVVGNTDTVTVSQVDNAVKMGMAYTIFPTKEGANNYWTDFNLPLAEDWDLTRTGGITFYAKIPENSGKGLNVELYLGENNSYSVPVVGKNYFYVAKGTDKVIKGVIADGDRPFIGKTGWEGWFFLPYGSIKNSDGKAATAASVAAAENVSLRIAVASEDVADYNKNYIIDEIGFYSEPLDYIKMVKALYVDKSANYIANDGSNAADTVIAQWDMSDQIVVSQSQLGVSPYGASISMTNASSGWNMYKTGYVLDVEEGWDLSSTNGIAFYVQIPNSDIDPALDFLLFISNSDYWYGSLSDAKIYYLADGSDTLTEDYATSLICHNMQGFSGFVFVPFDSFKGMSGKRGVVNEATRFEWRVNATQTDKSLLGKTYVFDELGFYSDPIAYVQKARELHGSYEYVINDASDSTTFNVTAGGDELLSAVQSSKGQPFSNAIVVTPNKSGFETAGVEINLKRQPIFDVTMNNGIGLYVNVPSGINASGISVSLEADGKSYSGTVSGKKVYYIEKNGTNLLSADASGILKDKAGFEGWLFIPFEAIDGLDRAVVDNAPSWKLTLSVNADQKAIGKKYVFDEIGFYSDPVVYARPVKDTSANYIAESFDNLSAMYATNVGTELRSVSGRTPYGSAMSIVPTKVRSDNTWDHLNINKDSNWNLENTEGIAMYVRMPGGISETQVTVMLYLNDSEFYPNNTGPVYYVPKNSDGSVVRVSSRQTLYDKVAFEGWVFIPYSSLTAHDGGKINVSALQERSSFQIRISHYRLNEDELNKDFIFDEIGFYSDRQMYIEAVHNKYGITGDVSDGNYIANHGDDVDLTSVLRDGNSFTAIEIDNRNSPFGTGIAVADTSPIEEWHSMRLGTVLNVENNTVAKNAKGVAFYAKFPDKVEDTYCNLLLYADEYHSYILSSGLLEDETPYTADYVTIGLDGKRTEVSARNALEGLQGFEGYIFIPYTSFRDTSDIAKTAADSIDYIANSRCEIRFAREFSTKDSYKRMYVVDELGFYNDEQAYIALAEGFIGSAGGNVSGNKITNSCASADGFRSEDDSSLSINIVGEKTTTGMSAEMISRYAEDSSTAAMLTMDTKSFIIKNSKGVAFYMDAPEAAEITFVIKVNETLSYKATKSVAAGQKGIVYIPFESFTDDVAKMTAALDMSYSIEALLVQSVASAGVGKGYVYDSVGFYSDETAYETLVESSFDETNDSIGNYPYTLEQLGITADNNLKTEVNNDSTTGIEVLDVTPENSAQQKLTFKISRAKSELWQLSKGITFFADLSEGGIAITSLSFKVGEQESVLNSGELQILPLADEYGTPTTVNGLSALDGKAAFVFIPFESLSPVAEATALATADTATLTIGISGSGKTAAIGGVGLYGGESAYIKAMRAAMGYGNYILNDGEQLSGWKLGDDGMYTISVNGKSPSGYAVALVPETVGADHYVNVSLDKLDGIEKTLGLAFFFNVPSGRNSVDMGIRLQISDTEYWEYSPYAPVYYAAAPDANIYTEKKAAVMSEMQGSKTYAFIPFSSMTRTYMSGNKKVTEALSANASKYLKNAENFELIINNKRNSSRDVYYEYIFDTVGLYSNIPAYLETAGKTATVSVVTSAGYASGKSDSAETKLHVINTLDNPEKVTVKGGTAAPATVNGGRAVSVKPNGAFEAIFSSDLYGAEEAKSADGIMLWVETPKGVTNPELTVTLTDKNGGKYTFSNGEYYYYCPDEGEHIVAMKGKLSLPEFAGNIIIPFEGFSNGNKLSFIDIKDITVSGGASLKGKEIVMQKAYAYPALDFLCMSLGDLKERYSVTASADSDSIIVSKDVIRLHDTALSYAKLLKALEISPSAFSLALPNGVKSSDIASGNITLDVMRGSIKVGSIKLEVVEEDIVPDTLVIITPEVPAVPDREVIVKQEVLVENDEFDDEDKPINELIRVKEAAASLVKLEGNTVVVNSVMAPNRLISAFTVADGVKLYVADNESYLVEGNVGVYDGYYLVVEYKGTKTGFKISGPAIPVDSQSNINIGLIIIIAVAVLVIAAAAVLFIIIAKKKKRRA